MLAKHAATCQAEAALLLYSPVLLRLRGCVVHYRGARCLAEGEALPALLYGGAV